MHLVSFGYLWEHSVIAYLIWILHFRGPAYCVAVVTLNYKLCIINILCCNQDYADGSYSDQIQISP